MTERRSDARLQKVFEAWRRDPLDGADFGVHDQEQLQHVAQALRAVARRRERFGRWRKGAAAFAVAAGVAGVAAAGWIAGHEPSDSVAVAVANRGAVRVSRAEGDLRLLDAGGQQLGPDQLLAPGVTLETQQGVAELEFPSGAHALTAEATRVKLVEAGAAQREALLLERGEVSVEVPRKDQPVEFSVRTPDALVVVHGTQFNVRFAPEAPAGSGTHVAVSHGLVAVHAAGQQIWLRPGQEWPPAAPASALPPVETTPAAQPRGEPAAEPGPSRRASRSVQHRRRVPQSATLAAENRVFAAAMAKHRAGDLDGALAGIERLLERYPNSVLVQEARVERFRLLHGLGRQAEAARQARSYLGDYHDGYAREEARSIALEQP